MPPRTRLTTVQENRSMRSNKVPLVQNFRIPLTRCDNSNNVSRSNKQLKKNIIKLEKKTPKPANSLKSKEKRKQHSSLVKRKSTKLEEKSTEIKKPVAVENDIRKPNSKTSTPKMITKEKQSPKKSITLENVKQSPIKTITSTTSNKEISKSEIRNKKPLLKKTLTKESRLRKQMKLGKIFIKPTFPIKSILKRQLHSGDKERNQGQFVTTTDSTTELNNNIVGVKRIQPKIVLRKIDRHAEKPTLREKRKIPRHL